MKQNPITSQDVLSWMEGRMDCMVAVQTIAFSDESITLTHILDLLELDGAECFLPLVLDSPEDIHVDILRQKLFWICYRKQMELIGREGMIRLVKDIIGGMLDEEEPFDKAI